ncbi:MAG: ATP-dependent DNA ligase [Candidatus Aenigmarchaeota archaeon]|nr:ATP-dependent DNA ligase [Candidatus Aenigmarchaeota archaeon]
MRKILSEFLKTIPKNEINIISYMTLGRIASKYSEVNIGMAEKMVLRSIADAAKKHMGVIEKEFMKKGDVGLVAEQNVRHGRKTLSAKEVFETLHKIANVSGAGSQEKKICLLSKLFANASPLEAKYLARIVVGQLRLGAGEKTLLDSMAIAFTGSKKAKKTIEHAYNVCPDIGVIAKTVVKSGLAGVGKIDVLPGRPVQMMLAQRVEKITDITKKIRGDIAAEEKYDGERVQAHSQNGKITLFSRRLENITAQFPDVIAALKKNIRSKTYILEGEVVPVDNKGNLLPFQILMARKRKHEIEKYASKVPVHFYIFDILLANGSSFLRQQYPKRRKMLEKITKECPPIFLSRRTVSKNIDDIESFFDDVLQRGCEGIVAKSCAADSYYTPGTRGWLWIKWKREYQKELADTFDLVIVGAFAGRGKRSGSYGALLCAVYNPDTEKFETLCKLGSGFSDEQLAELPKKFPAIKQQPSNVSVAKNMTPDIWVAPEQVIEVLGAEITKSQLHTAGSGLALRFPRFVRYRHDKSPEQATTPKEILKIMKARSYK